MGYYKRIILTLLIAFIFSYAWYKIFAIGYQKYYSHNHPRLNKIFLDETAYDILFLGSSRAHTSINPRVVDSITGYSSYNAGVEGGNLLEFIMTFKGYLEKHPPPKLLVLLIDANSFSLERKFFNYLHYFDVLGNRTVDSTLSANGINTFSLKYFPVIRLIRYDEQTKNNVFHGLMGKQEIKPGEFDYKGYLSNTLVCTDTNIIYKPFEVQFNPEAIKYLDEIIRICKTQNIQLVTAYAPEYKFRLQTGFSNFNQFVQLMDSVSAKHSIPFYRDDSLKIYDQHCLFANNGHLNTRGATVYSEILGNRLKTSNNLNERNYSGRR